MIQEKQIKKPWGAEEIIEINEKYMVKKLTMKVDHRCSLQYHEKKRETIFVLSGKLRVIYGETLETLITTELDPGDTLTLLPGIIHRMEGASDAIYLEASTPEMEDVIRISDDYNRETI